MPGAVAAVAEMNDQLSVELRASRRVAEIVSAAQDREEWLPGRDMLDVSIDVGERVAVATLRRCAARPGRRAIVIGSSRDRAALAQLLAGSTRSSPHWALPVRTTPRSDTAAPLVDAMHTAGVRRFVGISGAGIDVSDDRKSARDRIISKIIQSTGGKAVADKLSECAVFAASDLDWPLVRPPRPLDKPATGNIEHHAHRSAVTTTINRGDLDVVIADVVERDW